MRIIKNLEQYGDEEVDEEEEAAAANMKTQPQQASLMPYDDLVSNRPGAGPADLYLRRADKEKEERKNLNFDPDPRAQQSVGGHLPGVSMGEEREKSFGKSRKNVSILSRKKKKTDDDKRKKKKKRRRLRTR